MTDTDTAALVEPLANMIDRILSTPEAHGWISGRESWRLDDRDMLCLRLTRADLTEISAALSRPAPEAARKTEGG